jgi:hypothetical protein
MIFGWDDLAGCMYSSVMISTHPRGWCGGIFLRTFGALEKSKNTILNMLKSEKWGELVVHMAPFDRTHTYPIDKLQGQVLKDTAWLESLQQQFPKTKIMPSPFCEHNHKANVMKPLFDKMRVKGPSMIFVNSIWKGQEVPGIITEIHIERIDKMPPVPRQEHIVSADGFGGEGTGDFCDARVDKIIAKYPNASQIRGWNFRNNGKFGHKDKATIAQRKHFPDKNYMLGHYELLEPRESGGEVFGKKGLYKAFADDHGQGGKDNHAMVIVNKKQPKLKVWDRNGKVIDELIRTTLGDYNAPGSPLHGFARFYSAKYAYQIAERAVKNTGSNIVKVEGLGFTDARMRSL